MNRSHAIILASVLLAGQLIAQAALQRHINPTEAPEEGLPGSLFLAIYRGAIDASIMGNYTEARSRLGEALKLYIPEALRYIIERFHQLLEETVSLLNMTHAEIEEAEANYELGFYEKAWESLNGASISLARARITLSELRAASRELTRMGPLTYLQRELEILMDRLEALSESYDASIRSLAEMLRGAKAMGTRLLIEAEEGEAWVGSKVTVRGILTSELDEPLENRSVTIYIGGRPSAQPITDEKGLFKAHLTIPLTYMPETWIQATFNPSGPDLGLLAASSSNMVRLRLLYLTPSLSIGLDKPRAIPTENFTITGQVDTPGLEVWASCLGMRLRAEADEDGRFKLIMRVPGDAAEGIHKIEVGTSARGIYGPARSSASIMVYRHQLNVDVELPPAAIAGLAMMVKGRVQGPLGPIPEMRVRIRAFGASETVMADGEGRFEAHLGVSHTHPSGLYPVEVEPIPSEPYYKAPSLRREVLTINPILLIPPAALAAIIARSLISARGPRRPREAEEAPQEPAAPEAEGLTGIPLIYHRAAEAVSRATLIEQRASDTVREYLERVRPRLGGGLEPFERLTHILEEEVYGGVRHDPEEAGRLLEELLRILGGGA